MTEDISGFVRLAVTMLLMALSVSTVGILLLIAYAMMDNFEERFITAVHAADNSVVAGLRQVKSCSGAMVYRIIEERPDRIGTVNITYLNGTTTSDYKTLLNNSAKLFELEISDQINGVYNFTITEVVQDGH